MTHQHCRRLLLRLGFLGGLGAALLLPQSSPAAPAAPARPANPPHYLAQTADVLAILRSLPTPGTVTGTISDLFNAGVYGQQARNFQATLQPEPAVAFYQEELAKLGYEEREINRVVGAWGFNLVFDTPDSLGLVPQEAAKQVVLVIQGTMLSPDTINLNVRFEEI